MPLRCHELSVWIPAELTSPLVSPEAMLWSTSVSSQPSGAADGGGPLRPHRYSIVESVTTIGVSSWFEI